MIEPADIRAALEREERTAAWLARKVRASEAQISRVLSGQRRLRPELAREIASVLRLPMTQDVELQEVS